MAPIAPADFFLWDAPRRLIDIRSADAFGRGSLDGAISSPADSHDTLQGLGQHLHDRRLDPPIHFIDLNGTTAAVLARHLSSDYLEGGYEAFRVWRENAFEAGPSVRLLGGYSGSRKTDILRELKKRGFEIIDLEELALHNGSVFGNLSAVRQPRHEHFQNMLLSIWLSLDPQTPVLIEEKGPFLGGVGLPRPLYHKMLVAPMVHLDVPLDQRLEVIQEEYGNLDPDKFRNALRKLETRMGMAQNHKALHYHDTGQRIKCFELLLNYYDTAYNRRRRMYRSGQATYVALDSGDLNRTVGKVESYLSDQRS